MKLDKTEIALIIILIIFCIWTGSVIHGTIEPLPRVPNAIDHEIYVIINETLGIK